jgi:hypothetical protein
VGRVGQHDPQEFGCGGRRDDLPLEALPDRRDKTRVVDVGMGEKDGVVGRRIERKGCG